MFDAITYFTTITQQNKLAQKEGFLPITISGPDNLEGIFEEFRDNDRFVAISDTNTGNISSNDGAYGFFKRRAYTVFILSAYEYNNLSDRQQQLTLCRQLFLQFVTKILHDKYTYNSEELMYVDTQSIPNQEIGRYYLSGLTGLFFTIYVQEPLSLEFNADQWT